MTHRLRIALLMLFALATWSAGADNLGFSKYKPLHVGIDLDYAPLEYVDQDGLPQGLDIELTQELLGRMDIPYAYSPNTWENISGDVINGRVDLAMMVYSPYRKSIVNYSRAVFRLYYQVVFRTGEKEEFDMRHIAGKEIAYMASRPITDTLQHAGARLHVVRDLPKALKELSGGKYDAVICFRYQAKYHIKQQHLDNLTAEDLTLTPREYCYVSTNRELIRAIDRELVRMEKDGTIDDIYGDYIAQLGNFEIPRWVWLLLVAAVVAFLIAFIFQQRVHAKRLQQEMERAQRSEKLKTVFLANVSHALRTPLNAIIGFSDVLNNAREGDLPWEDQKQMLSLINNNGQQLLYFINELLQLSNIEGNGLQFQRVEANISEIMEAYRQEVEPQLAEGITLDITTEYPQLTALLDTNQMRLVTMHLLKNAIKYTREGGITVSYGPRDGGLYVEVKDTGVGLPTELKENIFTLLNEKNTFIRDENPGLGLSICKAVIDAVHGRIGVDSEQGKGSTFWYWVPVQVKKGE